MQLLDLDDPELQLTYAPNCRFMASSAAPDIIETVRRILQRRFDRGRTALIRTFNPASGSEFSPQGRG
ncbi:MAG: hypothetical protein J0I52_15700 [Bordetella sp.]|nr:hypothetical protein [Bordetella sp.]